MADRAATAIWLYEAQLIVTVLNVAVWLLEKPASMAGNNMPRDRAQQEDAGTVETKSFVVRLSKLGETQTLGGAKQKLLDVVLDLCQLRPLGLTTSNFKTLLIFTLPVLRETK